MFWTKAEEREGLREAGSWSVTLVTQLGLNRLARLEELLESWQGPISAAILVCSQQDVTELKAWYHRVRSIQRDRLAERFLSLHIVVGARNPYPVNVMRNIAQDGVLHAEGFSFIVDIDAKVGGQSLEVSRDVQRATESLRLSDSAVLCVAAFELAIAPPTIGSVSRHLPKDYLELRAMLNAGAVRPMHVNHRSYSGPFSHTEWVARREAYRLVYEVMFEPYFVRRTAGNWPIFPEQFKGRGFNKQAHHFELFARGHEYAVLGKTFVLDIPHDDPSWTSSSVTLQDNKPLWYAFREDIAQQVGLVCHEEDWARCDRRGVGCHRVCQSDKTRERSTRRMHHSNTPNQVQQPSIQGHSQLRNGHTDVSEVRGNGLTDSPNKGSDEQEPKHFREEILELENADAQADIEDTLLRNTHLADERSRVASRTPRVARDRESPAKRGGRLHGAAGGGDLYWKVFLDGLESQPRRKVLPRGISCRDAQGHPVVDVVYTWVNGSDPAHIALRGQYIPPDAYSGTMDVGEGRSKPVGNLEYRFRDFGKASTLLFSLRSIRVFAPWIRNIYIVTADRQRPSWLDEDKAETMNIHFVSHKTIFSSKQGALPTFNSCAIETQISKIPGLAECYIYLNDDFLLGKKLDFEDLWPEDSSLPNIHFGVERAPRIGRDPWQQKIANVGKMMHRDLGYRWEHMFTVGHQGFFFIKSIVEEVETRMKAEFDRTAYEHWRTPYSLWVPFVYANYYAHEFDAKAKKGSAAYIRINDFTIEDKALPDALERIRSRKPQWICINDLVTQPSNDLIEALYTMLSSLYPDPAPYERF